MKSILAAETFVIFALISVYNCSRIPNRVSTTNSRSSDPRNNSSLSDVKHRNNSDSSTTVAPLTTSTEPILPEWGGNCTKKDWDKCSHLKLWVTSSYVDRKHPERGFRYHETNCTAEPPLCLRNGWTVTRCQLLCMRCNREIISKYNKYVAKEEKC